MNIILQHFDGELRPLDKLSMANIQEYAKMVGADYELIRGKPFRSYLTPACQKVFMLDESFDKYDQVLMIDIDMFATKGLKENVFDVPGIGLVEEVQHHWHKVLSSHMRNEGYPYWGGAIYKMDRYTRQTLRSGLGVDETWMLKYNKPFKCEDEGIIHELSIRTKYKSLLPNLERKWCYCSFLPYPQTASFIHIRTKITPDGPKREKIENYKALVEKGII